MSNYWNSETCLIFNTEINYSIDWNNSFYLDSRTRTFDAYLPNKDQLWYIFNDPSDLSDPRSERLRLSMISE